MEGVGGKSMHTHFNIQSLGSVSRPLTQHAFGGGVPEKNWGEERANRLLAG